MKSKSGDKLSMHYSGEVHAAPLQMPMPHVLASALWDVNNSNVHSTHLLDLK